MTAVARRGRRPVVHRGVEFRGGRQVEGEARATGHPAVAGSAKVARDALMAEPDARHPGYGLARNEGYGCPHHRDALRRMGPSPIHRRSFHGTQVWLFS